MPKWTPDDHGCIYDETGCFARLTPNKAERLATRHNADIDALTAERDRLAAENAELQIACNELSDDLSRMNQLELEAKCHDDLEKSHAIMVQVVAERDAELSAANDTLDRLREVLAKWMAFDGFNAYDAIGEIRAILYPPNTPSIRDTAAAHGFDAMPSDLAQRSVDGETNYVRLNPENDT